VTAAEPEDLSPVQQQRKRDYEASYASGRALVRNQKRLRTLRAQIAQLRGEPQSRAMTQEEFVAKTAQYLDD
jgi:hypothetical protein